MSGSARYTLLSFLAKAVDPCCLGIMTHTEERNAILYYLPFLRVIGESWHSFGFGNSQHLTKTAYQAFYVLQTSTANQAICSSISLQFCNFDCSKKTQHGNHQRRC